MQAHSRLHPHSNPVPPPHSCVVFSLCPLRGFVLLSQCQRPGDEVTLHRRAAGLTEPRPSPPPSSVLGRTVVSPPPAHHIYASAQTTSPMLYAHETMGHTDTHIIICRRFISSKLHDPIACAEKHTHMLISKHTQTHS